MGILDRKRLVKFIDIALAAVVIFCVVRDYVSERGRYLGRLWSGSAAAGGRWTLLLIIQSAGREVSARTRDR